MASYTFLGNPPPNVQEWIKKHYGPKLDDPLCFTAVDAGATIAFNKVGNPDAASIVYATESSGQRTALDWQPYTFNTMITLANVGDKVYFRAADENNISFYKSNRNYYRFAMTVGKKIAASGNIQTLMKADGSILDISGKIGCYINMFRGCMSLTTAPELPATTLADNCYYSMFFGCSSLTTAPELPATTLAEGCYNSMFSNCSSLTSASALPATTLADNCYNSMFSNCSSLTSAPTLPATTLAYLCYHSMFNSCDSLTTAPELPATTLANGCYSSMFYNCSSLTTAPELPATTLVDNCYNSMFFNCPNVIEITFANLTCEYVAANALEWGLGIDRNYHKFLVVAYCSDGIVVINDNDGSSSDGGEGATKVTYVDGTKKTFKIKGELTSSSIDNISNIKEVEIGSDVTGIGGTCV